MVRYFATLTITTIFLLFAFTHGNDFCSLEKCTPLKSDRSEMKDFCTKRNGTLTNRCCILNETAIGLDFSNCNVTNLEVFQKLVPIETRSILEFILLDTNPVKTNNDRAFYNYVNLNYLSVPWPLTCPGDVYLAWNKTQRDEPRNATICTDQVTYCDSHEDACIELAEYPDHAYCVPKGPSLFECPCSPGVYGYKCLRRGEFPTVILAPVISAATVIFSAGLWYTQRRFVVKSPPPPSHNAEHQH